MNERCQYKPETVIEHKKVTKPKESEYAILRFGGAYSVMNSVIICVESKLGLLSSIFARFCFVTSSLLEQTKLSCLDTTTGVGDGKLI